MNIELPVMIRNMLASPPMRAYHHLWHLVRNEQRWNELPPSERQELVDLDWTPPRFEQQPGSGLDFLFMHREMIKMVNEHLYHSGDPNYLHVEGWNPIPYEHNDLTWPCHLPGPVLIKRLPGQKTCERHNTSEIE